MKPFLNMITRQIYSVFSHYIIHLVLFAFIITFVIFFIEKLGIKKENIFTQLLPQGKVSQLQSILDNSNKKVIFVGDGVNDAPVLSMADIGIAMGGVGSDIAVETADIVIMKDEPSKIIEVLKIANINKKVVIQNIVFALGIKILVMILGVFGIANMWMAIFSDVGVSLLAVLNASWGVKRYFK